MHACVQASMRAYYGCVPTNTCVALHHDSIVVTLEVIGFVSES